MSEKRYTTILGLSIGGDVPTWEGEATVTYKVAWGAPERAPAYDHGGLPADPDEVIDVQVSHLDGVPCGLLAGGREHARILENKIECSEKLIATLLEIAVAEAADDAADEREWRFEEARER